jgi:hypothetical protein
MRFNSRICNRQAFLLARGSQFFAHERHRDEFRANEQIVKSKRKKAILMGNNLPGGGERCKPALNPTYC